MNKVYSYIFSAFCLVSAVVIAMGAYWHIYTLGVCALLVWSIKNDKRDSRTNKTR